MSALDHWPQSEPMSLAEWVALPEDTSRHFELVDGVIIVSPKPKPRHQRVVYRVAATLDGALSPSWAAVPQVEMVIDTGHPATVRAPDVVVVRPAAVDDRPHVAPSDVLVLVEVLEAGTRRRDRTDKVADYAEVGVECYLLVESGPPVTLSELRLYEGSYQRIAEHRDIARITLDGVEVTFDLAGMLEP